MIFRFFAANKTMCRVPRSGCHAWAGRSPSVRALEDERLTERIHEVHRADRKVYGSPRIHAELRMADGVRDAHRVERLMRAYRTEQREQRPTIVISARSGV